MRKKGSESTISQDSITDELKGIRTADDKQPNSHLGLSSNPDKATIFDLRSDYAKNLFSKVFKVELPENANVVAVFPGKNGKYDLNTRDDRVVALEGTPDSIGGYVVLGPTQNTPPQNINTGNVNVSPRPVSYPTPVVYTEDVERR